ncbi:hypothetical protein PUN4_890017 [Paraburkholderia unamae]|nr:hypothetical protein PUN4_890017 [Paraburkholderia unamae]
MRRSTASNGAAEDSIAGAGAYCRQQECEPLHACARMVARRLGGGHGHPQESPDFIRTPYQSSYTLLSLGASYPNPTLEYAEDLSYSY